MWKTAVVLTALLALSWGIRHWLWSNASTNSEITAGVVRGELPVIVTERGELESAKTITVKCEVEVEQIKIVSVLPEGTRLTKGQEVLRFDTDKLQRTLAEQQIKVKQAEGKAEAARQELEVQRNKGEGEIAKADLTLTLAELDLEKYVKGDYKVELEEKLGGIKMAEKDLRDAEEKLKHYITLVRKGFETPDRLRQMELEVEKSRNNLERDKAKLMVLETYTLKRQQAEFSGKAADAKRELARTRASTAAVLAKAKADLEAAEGVAKLEKDQLKRDQEKLKLAVVRARKTASWSMPKRATGTRTRASRRGEWSVSSSISSSCPI